MSTETMPASLLSTSATYGQLLQQRMQHEDATIAEITSSLIAAMEKQGFGAKADYLQQALCNQELRKDTLDDTYSFYAEWRTPTGALKGYLIIHGGGQVYAECDVVEPHPTDKRWFVEAITAWGQQGGIKTEPRLLPALGD